MKANFFLFIPTMMAICSTASFGMSANSGDVLPVFEEVTEEVGLITSKTWKYGGPAVADINNDGHYDLMLSNHHIVPAQLFWGTSEHNYKEHSKPLMKFDVHGIAPGDYDHDGDADVLVSVGGGNGSSPQPPRLLRNDGGQFSDVTDEAGIGDMGARGRAVRWVDLDGDGDLDILQINAPVVIGEKIPRNLMHENLGNGKFRYIANSEIENIDAERVLLTDFNGDHIPDLICFTPLSLWQGKGDFEFNNVTQKMLPESLHDTQHVMAVADLDFDNDGDLDVYLARGKTYYELANNSVTLDRSSGRLDLRDEGNKSHDGLTFWADDRVQLHDFSHWPRGVEFQPQVFLGKAKTAIDAPAEPMSVASEDAMGFPQSVDQSGWYLGYLGDGKWRLEWLLKSNLAWGLRASISGVKEFETAWEPQSPGVADLLLLNENGRFTDASQLLPKEANDNNWGVTVGDLNNDSWTDLFVYRFGGLNERVTDALFMNAGGKRLTSSLVHGAVNVDEPTSHGDMGAAFDYDLDGRVDILSGNDDQGSWKLYQNTTPEAGNYSLVRVAYSPKGVDAIGAEIWLESNGKTYYRRVGSAGATHSQSVLNTAHFGLGGNTEISRITVRWRDGYEQSVKNPKSNQRIVFGSAP